MNELCFYIILYYLCIGNLLLIMEMIKLTVMLRLNMIVLINFSLKIEN